MPLQQQHSAVFWPVIIALYIICFIIIFTLRRRDILGKHLSATANNPNDLYYKTRCRYQIGIAKNSPFPMDLKQERFYHRILKFFSVATEIQFNDKSFDDAYFLATDHPDHLSSVDISSSLLKLFKELFSLPVNSLHIRRERIWCEIKKEDYDKADSHFTKHRKILNKISECLSTHHNGPSSKRNESFDFFKATIILCLHVGILVFGLAGLTSTIADSISIIQIKVFIAYSFILGLFFAILWCSCIVWILKRTSWIGWVLADFVIVALTGICLTATFVTRTYNIYGPQEPPKVTEQRVINKQCVIECGRISGRRSSTGSSYSLDTPEKCEPAHRYKEIALKKYQDDVCNAGSYFVYKLYIEGFDNKESYHFEPSAELFDSVHVGSYIDVPVHSGAMGIKWIDRGSIKPATP